MKCDLLSLAVKAVRGTIVLIVLAGPILASCSAPAEIDAATSLRECVADRFGSSPGGSVAPASLSPDVLIQMHRLRNMGAMVELFSAIPQGERPRVIAYLASGDHLAPLALCELLPAGEACRLVLTEIDPAVQEGIAEGLAGLEQESCLEVLKTDPPILGASGRREWTLVVGGERAVIELRVTDPGAPEGSELITPELLSEVDLVITHDWSGEPIGNLQVIHQFVVAARRSQEMPPMLMIEDLGAHLYPVDLFPFVRRAFSPKAYGHRASDEGPGRHGLVELGEPVFGGAVVLDFSDAWWRTIDDQRLAGFFDFLLLNQFDIDRRNVLTGGPEPLVAPMLLDWWTGYGARGIDGKRFEPGAEFRVRMLDAALQVADLCGPSLGRRIACRLRLYSLLLGIRVAGEETIDLMPGGTASKGSDALASPEMERLYRRALRRAGEFRAEREAFGPVAEGLLQLLSQDRATAVLDKCPAGAGGEVEGQASDPRSAYRDLLASMSRDPAAFP